jgi:predicted NUDIX family NTP pyrophosphohydrolase
MGKAVGIWTIEVGMVAETYGEVVAVQRTRPDEVKVTFADGYVRRIGLGGYIYI